MALDQNFVNVKNKRGYRMLNMQIVRNINALCKLKGNLRAWIQYLNDKHCTISPRFGFEPLTRKEYDQFKEEVEYSAQMNKKLKTMLDSIDKDIEENIAKLNF